MQDNKNNIAVVIDVENIGASDCDDILSEIAKFGTVSIKRAYTDWTQPKYSRWKEKLIEHAIQPIQQFNNISGKNSSDSSLIIDAMDILHNRQIDGFCIISSDSDFTRLATRIREDGIIVYGFGLKITPRIFQSACDKFITIENIRSNLDKEVVNESPSENLKSQTNSEHLKKILFKAIRAMDKDEEEWVGLGGVGATLLKLNPSFDSRTYGYERLGLLISSLDYIEVQIRQINEVSKTMYIRIKDM